MFSIFKKKVSPYPTESNWSVLQGVNGDKPMFIRRNDSAVGFAGHPDFKFRIGVAIPLIAPTEDGFPTNDEMEQLNVIEDALTEQLEIEQRALHVLAITTSGMREFVFYSRVPASAEAIVENLRAKISTHEPQSYVTEDAKWELFKQFV